MASFRLSSALPLLLPLILALLPLVDAFQNCPFVGPDFPKPTQLSTGGPLKFAFSNLTLSLAQLISTGNSSYGTLDASENSFSIEVFLAQDPPSSSLTTPQLTSLRSIQPASPPSIPTPYIELAASQNFSAYILSSSRLATCISTSQSRDMFPN